MGWYCHVDKGWHWHEWHQRSASNSTVFAGYGVCAAFCCDCMPAKRLVVRGSDVWRTFDVP